MSKDTLLQAADVSRLLNLSLTTVYYYASKKIIPCCRIGNKIRFKESEILRLLEGSNDTSRAKDTN